tara:strand:+ start:87287 stop:89407 length:2121 start_codon:yes stop_codon:yes gene_type:complete
MLKTRSIICTLAFLILSPIYSGAIAADNAAFKSIELRSIYGQAGTLTTPNARHFKAGTFGLHIATLDPYIHYALGLEVFDGLHAQLRQSAEISSAQDDADRLFPGVDFKLRLAHESLYRPEISIGLTSAIGHKRMAGEYIAASKRRGNFDFTAGIGWGRYGTAAHFDNPLNAFGQHFNTDRDLNGETANGPENWFTGKNIGFFGSAVWYSPIRGLSLSADYGADRYSIEQEVITGYESPAAWSVGLSYNPVSWAHFGLGLNGTNKIMGQMQFSAPIQNLAVRPSKRDGRPSIPNRLIQKMSGEQALLFFGEDNTAIFLSKESYNDYEKSAQLETAGRHETLPYVIGQSAKTLIQDSYADLNAVKIHTQRYGLRGPTVKIQKQDLYNAVHENRGSAEEIWHNAEITAKPFKASSLPKAYKKLRSKFWGFTLENHTSLNEEDNGTLTRSSFLVSRRFPIHRNLLSVNRLRLNLFDNLTGLKYLRQNSPSTVRGNVEDFAANGLSYDQMALIYNDSYGQNTYFALSGGYLEEMYFGAGGEILYRPFNNTWAIGAELYDVIKRNPFTAGASGFDIGSDTITGHINAYYEVPNSNSTISLSAGRYLAKDYGASLSFAKIFKNGASFNTFITASQKQDKDIFGGTTHTYGGLNLTLPLGSLSYLPQGSALALKTAPLGRNSAQRLELPFNLYKETEQLSRRHLIQNWSDITK